MVGKQRNAFVWGMLWCGWCRASEGTTESSRSFIHEQVVKINEALGSVQNSGMPLEVDVLMITRKGQSDKTKENAELGEKDFVNTYQQIKELINKLPENAVKLIVFQETFFKKSSPLEEFPHNNTTKYGNNANYYLDRLKELTKISQQIYIYANFLLQQSKKNWEKNGYLELAQKAYRSYEYEAKKEVMIPEKSNGEQKYTLYYTTCGEIGIGSMGYAEDKTNQIITNSVGVFKNITYGIAEGGLQTQYVKRTYYDEYNKGFFIGRGNCQQKMIYQYGKGQDEIFNAENPGKLARNMLSSITTEICRDLCLGVRNGRWTNLEEPRMESIVHIIQSNVLDVLQYKDNLPKNKLIISVDPLVDSKVLFIDDFDNVCCVSDECDWDQRKRESLLTTDNESATIKLVRLM